MAKAIVPPLTGLGAAVYFEHHARDKWKWLADSLAQVGVSFCRIGEFTWDLMEREDGLFDFSWLDEVVALLQERRISVVIGTPTASPPDWLCARHPEIVPVKIDGDSFGTGCRRHTCPTAPAYRQASERIVRALGRHFADNPSIVAWQIDNEIGHPFCYCDLCREAFRGWLKKEFHDDIDDFNFGIGQFFLGRTTRSFDEVPLPTPNSNPCLHQVYNRFMDHQIRLCWGLQKDWLREEGSNAPITANTMTTWYGYDHEKLFERLDVASADYYPDENPFPDGRGFLGLSFVTAYTRGMKHGETFGMLETRWGPTTQDPAYPLPGEVRFWTFCYLAGGANFIEFFRFESCPSGVERNLFGLIPSSGVKPDTFWEVKELAQEIEQLLPEVLETTVPTAPVGILYSHPSHLSLQHFPDLPALDGPFGNGYTIHLARHIRSVAGLNIPVDVVYTGEDFGKYRVLSVSGTVVMEPQLAEKLKAFVESGGILVVFPRTGTQDENARMWECPVPYGLTDVLGAKVVSSEVLSSMTSVAFFSFPSRIKAESVVDVLDLTAGTEVLASYEDDSVFGGKPAVTRRKWGNGTAYYVGCYLDEQSLRQMYAHLLEQHNIVPELEVPDGINYARRTGESGSMYFFFNSGGETREVQLPEGFADASTKEPVSVLVIDPRGCFAVKKLE